MLNSTTFKSSIEVFDWISGFINYEKVKNNREFRLDRMKSLSKAAGEPDKCAPSIHVAGSKGKGSVTGMVASILEAAGKKTARYASPHVNDFRERILLGSRFFDEDIYANAGMELRELLSNNFPANAGSEEAPTFFELVTLWYFLCARLAGCNALAVETGMGGRLDATNILDPLVSVITIIELEHTEYLGNTIAAIAGEKAGIIKQDRPLVLAEQSEEALKVFKEHTAKANSPLIYFPDCAELQNIRLSRQGTYFDLVLKPHPARETYPELFIPIPGEVQAKNAGLAALAVKTAFPDITEKEIRKGLAAFTLPARFEKISENPPVIVDGAHTPSSIDFCLKTFTALYGSKGILIFGCAAEKNVPAMAELCVPCFSRIIITTPGTFKKSNPQEIYRVFVAEAEKTKSKPEILFIPETKKAIDTAFNLAVNEKLPVLGAGSFYLAGEVRMFGN